MNVGEIRVEPWNNVQCLVAWGGFISELTFELPDELASSRKQLLVFARPVAIAYLPPERRGQCSNAADAKNHLKDEYQIEVSTDTVRRTLQRYGLSARVKKRKPLLSKKHRKQRMEFAKKHLDWTVEQWKTVVWSDESKFTLYRNTGREYCYRRKGEPLRNRHVKPTIKHGGRSLLVWGCITEYGVGNLCKIDGGLNALLYCSILQKDFLGTFDYYGMDRSKYIFQQDNDPKHTARTTKAWLKNSKVQVLE
ncbi:uncharacterized protein VTP21DRAFT_10809 [Calcarisporiella thermophila]|uniref:uncharacterized protein n=1 Tax=Calcarisporiella thermophila TaxID=911321 RepID=UPI0037439516